jgi:uncharacterized protein (DUF362 family)
MSEKFSRREWLVSAGVAGAMAAGSMARAATKKPNPGPDRSQKAPTAPVAITRCESYEPQPLRRRIDETLALIGGIKTLCEGKHVTIKLNVTGGPKAGKLAGREAFETYHVHPAFVAAVCGAVRAAGAKQIVLVESSYELLPLDQILGNGGWDIRAIREAGEHKVQFLDTRNRGPFAKYSRLSVPWGGFVYPAYDVCQAYEKTDVFISLAKLKDHAQAGVTMGAKNLFGIAPTSLYGGDAPNENTTHYRGPVLHDGSKKVPAGVPAELDHGIAVKDWGRRVPRVTADMNGIRPIDLVIVDGILTNRGGEGPWIKGVEALDPKVILAGRNVVCTDAICTAVMGYDPLADHFTFPFQSENHLKLLAQVGLGASDPKRIEVRGLSVKEALFPFNPKRLKIEQPVAWEEWNYFRMGQYGQA